MADNERPTVERDSNQPHPTVKKTKPDAPENLGQEGARSSIKPNTTNAGEPQDRGP